MLFIKMTRDINTVRNCQSMFSSKLPGEQRKNVFTATGLNGTARRIRVHCISVAQCCFTI